MLRRQTESWQYLGGLCRFLNGRRYPFLKKTLVVKCNFLFANVIRINVNSKFSLANTILHM